MQNAEYRGVSRLSDQEGRVTEVANGCEGATGLVIGLFELPGRSKAFPRLLKSHTLR